MVFQLTENTGEHAQFDHYFHDPGRSLCCVFQRIKYITLNFLLEYSCPLCPNPTGHEKKTLLYGCCITYCCWQAVLCHCYSVIRVVSCVDYSDSIQSMCLLQLHYIWFNCRVKSIVNAKKTSNGHVVKKRASLRLHVPVKPV